MRQLALAAVAPVFNQHREQTAIGIIARRAACKWILPFVLLSVGGLAQSTAAAAPLTAGTTFKADLNGSISSANDQVGDQVSVTTTETVKQGQTSLPKGTVLNGHVTQVTNSENAGQAGIIGILFDQAVTPKGQTLKLLAGIASVTAPKAASSGPGSGRSGGRGRGGGYPGGGFPGGGYPGGGGNPGGSGSPRPLPLPADTTTTTTRFPANANQTGGILTKADGNVYVAPASHLVLQIIAPAA